jgi:hemerythrin
MERKPTEHIKWSDEFSVNVDLIDRQHKEFVQVLNELYDVTMSQGSSKTINDVFKMLDLYTNYHFATEEKYFDEFNFEGSEEHKEAHRAFVQRLGDFKARHDKGEDIVLELLDTTEDWLVNHLAYYDKKYTECFNEHGLK